MSEKELAKELREEIIEEVKEFLHIRADAFDLKPTHRSIERSIRKILREHAEKAKQFNKIEIFHLKLAMKHYLKAEIAEAHQRIKDDEWNTEEGVATSAALDDLGVLYEKVKREFKS